MADEEKKDKDEEKKSIWAQYIPLIPVFLALFGWALSMEARMSKVDATSNLAKRVTQLEDALLPVLVDWKVEQEMKKRLKEMALVPLPLPPSPPGLGSAPNPNPKPLPPAPAPNAPTLSFNSGQSIFDPGPPPEAMKKAAKKWAESQIRQQPLDSE